MVYLGRGVFVLLFFLFIKCNASRIPSDEIFGETKQLGVELSKPSHRELSHEGFQNFAQSPVVLVSAEETEKERSSLDFVTSSTIETGINEIPDILKHLPFDQSSIETVDGENARGNSSPKHEYQTSSSTKAHHLREQELNDYEWEGEESKEFSHFGHFSNARDEDHSEGEEEYEWMEEPTRERVIPLDSLPPGIEKKNIALEQVETGLVYLLKTAHHNGLTAHDIISHLQQRLKKSDEEQKHNFHDSSGSKLPVSSNIM